MTLGEMKAQFVSMMNRTDLKNNATLVTTFMNQAILRIQRELRAPFMEKVVSLPIADGFTALPIPNDLLELIAIYVGPNQEYELQRDEKTKVNYLASYGSGMPLKFARVGSNLVIGPKPAVGDTLLFTYYASFPTLTSDASSNGLTQVAWDLAVYCALSIACDYYVDDRGPAFENKYQQIREGLQAMADADELTADAAVSPVYSWPED